MHTKSEILSAFETKWQEVSSLIENIEDSQFNRKNDDGKWSIAQEFDHMIKSASALSSALKRKPFLYKWKFGKPNRPLRSYAGVESRYQERLAEVKGKAVAPSAYISSPDQIFDKSEMLSHWNSTMKKFNVRVKKWSDKNLDKVLLPHPLLGKMMIREMLFFTHIHTSHHLENLSTKK